MQSATFLVLVTFVSVIFSSEGSVARASSLSTSPYLLGDWSGDRTHLENEGATFIVGYGGESGHNFSGGTKQLTDYTDQWVFGAQLDFEKLKLWRGGNFELIITDRNGDDLGADANIGNDMLIQEVYGRGQTWHLTHFWFNQKLFENSIELKLGRATVGDDFASFSCDFQNLSFCGAQPGNIVGNYWINWPTSVWAARIKLNSSEKISWQVGAYQVNPNYVDDNYAQNYGMSLENPSGSTGTLLPFEFTLARDFLNQPGVYKFGGWYNTNEAPQLTNPADSRSQFGGYISVLQQLTGSKAAPGLSLFLNVTQTDKVTSLIDRQISVGTQFHGLSVRRADSIGFAVATTHNIRVGDEYDGELYYSYAPIASLYLRPNLQYILQPGGTIQNPNAFIAGLKTGVAF